MVDPLSITGVAISLVSLGLQACQGLTAYYDSWKASDEHIRRALEKIASLNSTLIRLDEILKQPDFSNLLATQNVQDITVPFRNGIKAVQDILDKCRSTTPGPNSNDRFQNIKKRAIYPFKKETIQSLEASVTQLNITLNTAVQVLLLYGASRNSLWPCWSSLKML